MKKQLRLGAILIFSSLALFWLTTHIWIPALSHNRYFYQANYNYLFTGNWGTHPPLIVQPLDLLEYLYKIFLPLGFLSFFGGSTLILALPILFQNTLSRNPMMHSLAFQYTSGLTPFVFISAIYGTKKVLSYFRQRGWKLAMNPILPSLILGLSFALTGRTEWYYFHKFKKKIDARNIEVRKILKKIPGNFSVTANDTLAPHLSHRFEVQQFEDYQRMKEKSVYPLTADLVILEQSVMQGIIEEEVKKVKSAGYHILYEKDGFFILGREMFPEITSLSN